MTQPHALDTMLIQSVHAENRVPLYLLFQQPPPLVTPEQPRLAWQTYWQDQAHLVADAMFTHLSSGLIDALFVEFCTRKAGIRTVASTATEGDYS